MAHGAFGHGAADQLDLDLVANRDIADIDLAHLGAHDDRVKRQQRGDRGAGLDPFAKLHIDAVDDARERRVQRQPVGGGLSLAQRRLGGRQCRALAYQLQLGGVAAAVKFLGHVKLLLALGQRGLGGFHPGGKLRAFDGHHAFTGGDVRALGNRQRQDHAACPRGKDRALVGIGHAGNADRAGVFLHLRRDRRDGAQRFGLAFRRVGRRLFLPGLILCGDGGIRLLAADRGEFPRADPDPGRDQHQDGGKAMRPETR